MSRALEVDESTIEPATVASWQLNTAIENLQNLPADRTPHDVYAAAIWAIAYNALRCLEPDAGAMLGVANTEEVKGDKGRPANEMPHIQDHRLAELGLEAERDRLVEWVESTDSKTIAYELSVRADKLEKMKQALIEVLATEEHRTAPANVARDVLTEIGVLVP